MIGNIQLTGIFYYFEFLRQLKVCYFKTEYHNSADLFRVNVIKIGAEIQNNKKFPSIVYFLLDMFGLYKTLISSKPIIPEH